jgi:broad specificity phosphatase PhoE
MAKTSLPRRIQLVMIRHSKSCSNYVRNVAGTHDPDHPLVKISQEIRDPALSAHGQQMAIAYGPALRTRLIDLEIDLRTARIASSGLARAHQTAELLFPDQRPIDTVPHVKEFGDIPENTPARRRRCKPDWRAFLRHIYTDTQHTQFVVVAHGSYLREVAWPSVSGGKKWPSGKFDNLDAFFVEGELTAQGTLHASRVVNLLRTPSLKVKGDDKCSMAIERKIAAHRKMTRYRQKQTRRSRKQRGGSATSMPLAYHVPTAFETRTTETTGAGLAGAAGNWIRTPLLRQGGGRHRRTRRRQAGGFAPSVMGAFASNGLRLLPVAGYMGYKMWNGSGQRKTQRSR